MTTQNVIRTLTIRSTTEGVPESTAALKSLQAAHENVAKVTETSAKHQLSMEKALAQNERRFNSALRSQQDFERVQKQVNAAVAQNPALQARANDVLRRAAEHYGQASASQTLFSRGMQAANDNAQAFASRLGPIGSVLSSLGPIGLGAAAGIGGIAFALHQAAGASLALADRAGKLKDFAETTGFSVIQLQALEKAGAQVGVSSESVTKGLERFSRQMVDVRKATGETFDQLLQADPVLAGQVARTTSLADAWDLVSKAIKQAPLEQANKIAVAFFGREGIQQTRLMRAGADAGGIAGLVSQLKEIDRILPEQAERWDQLGDAIAENMKAGKQNVVSIFAEPTLVALHELSAGFLVLSRAMKEISQSTPPPATEWDKWIKSFTSGLRAMQPLIGPFILAMQLLRGAGRSEIATPARTTPAIAFRFNSDSDADHAAAAAAIKDRAAETVRLANEEKRRMEALGGAATAQEKYNAKFKEISALIAEYPHLQAEANRQLADFKIEQQNAALTRRIGLLGEMASVGDIVKQKQNEINAAIKEGARFSPEEIKAMQDRNRLLAEAAKLENQLAFERAQMFRSPTDARISETLRTQGIEPGSKRGVNVAEMIRFNEQMKLAIDLSSEFATGFIRDMRQGASAMQALTNAVNRLADRLIEMAVQNLVKNALGGASAGLSNLFNFGSLAGSGVNGSGLPAAPANVGHAGGIIGQSAFPKRYVHRAYFDDAPRMHGGGDINWAAGERPFIGQVGETIVPRGGSAGGTNVVVNVTNNSGGPVEQRETQGADGSRIIDIVIGKVKDDYAKGGFDGANRSRYGVQPTSARR